MPTRLIEPEVCNCYKCVQKREVGTFTKYVASFFRNIGFIPRNFDKNKNYNGVYHVSREDELSAIVSIKEGMERVQKWNDEARKDNKKKHACYDCGRLDTPSKARLHEHNGSFVHICRVCAKDIYSRCSSCGYLHHKSEFRRDTEGNKICSSCFEKHYFKCAKCDTVHRKETGVSFSHTGATGFPTKILVCPICSRNARNCTSCGTITFYSAEQWSRNQSMCQNCYTEAFGIKSYSYKPTPKLKFDKTEKHFDKYSLFLGIEWELENKSDYTNEKQIEKISNVFKPGFVYYKSDGSLSHGFEIVSHPFSKKHWKSNRELWNTAIDTVKSNYMKAMPSCGIHIHMTKSAFTPAHLYKFSKFICHQDNRPFIIRISQRGGENNYARFHPNDCTSKGFIHIGKNKKNDSGARHTAVNATGDNTVEVRIFASTTDRRDFFKNVEFIFSAFEFSNEFGFKDMTVPKFMSWISQKNRTAEYPNLYSFLHDKKIWDAAFLKTYFKEVK